MNQSRFVETLAPGVHLSGNGTDSGMIHDPKQVQVGHWYSVCCHLDLWQIENENELADIHGEMQEYLEEEFGALKHDIWPTRRDALLELRVRWPEWSRERAECDQMLANLE